MVGECWIFGAGSFYGLVKQPADGDFLIAADGGYLHCRAAGLAPHLVIGDFDSMEEVPGCENVLRLPVEKDDTDTLAAIREGLRRGYDRFRIFGGTGGKRPEHTLANLQSLLLLAKKGARGWLYDEYSVCIVLRNGTLKMRGSGDLSVFAMDGAARGVTLCGLKYSLQDAELTPDFPLGVSNAFLDGVAEITVREGTLLVVLCTPEAEAAGSGEERR